MRSGGRNPRPVAWRVFGLALLALAAASAGGALSASLPPAAASPEPDRRAPTGAPAPWPSADPVARWRPYTTEASRRFGLPIAWIERVIRAESGGHTARAGRPVVSRAGAMGLMQLMPATWAEMRAAYALGPDPFDPRANILAGTAYLAALYRRFGYPGLFGAYNAGPARYQAWLEGRAALPAETRLYLARLTGDAAPPAVSRRGAALAAKDGEPPASVLAGPSPRERLFMVDRAAPASAAPRPPASEIAEGARPDRLFVALSRGAPAASGD